MRESHPPFPPQNNKTVMLESHPKFNWPAWDLTIILMMIMIIIIINNNIIQLILEVPRQTISVNIFWETLIGVIADVSDGWCTPTRWKNRNLSNHFGQIRMQSSRCIKKRKSQDTCDLAGILARLDVLKCVDPMKCVTQPKGLHVYTVKIL